MQSHRRVILNLAVAIAGLALAATPTRAQQLDPVKGPVSLQAPGPFYEGTRGGGTYSYAIKSDFGRVRTFTYTDGEVLKGKADWTTAPAADAAATGTGDSGQSGAAAVWDLIYGSGYYAAHVAGRRILEGTFTGDKGTTLEVQSLDEFLAVGADNHGDFYKIVW